MIYSTREVMDEFAFAHLSQIVPEDVEVCYSVNVVMLTQRDEETGEMSMGPHYRIVLHSLFPEGPGGEVGKCYTVEHYIPAHYLDDGDVDPLEEHLDSMWEKAQMAQICGPVMPDLEKVLSESGETDEG